MENLIRAALRKALDPAALTAAIQESIEENLDYELIANALLEDYDILEMAAEEASHFLPW